MINKNLELDIDNLLFMMECVENDLTKMAVTTEFDDNLEMKYAIDVEDKSFFYDNENERDKDFDELCGILSEKSKRYWYS